ncbi:MAG: NAD(P)H-dependent oxidoreductase [Proteobacteria bacterium]|nr:NAD(P)H-dependent oxidoreductase [Pseudomonadota bacterium]
MRTSTPAPTMLALFASSRRDGNTGRFMDQIAHELGIEVVDLARLRISPYDYAHGNRGDDFEPLMQRILAHRQVIFATPVYWYSVSPPMKCFLDRISDYLEVPELIPQGRRLRGKRAYVVCTSVCEQPPAAFLAAFRETFEYLGMQYSGVAHLNCEDGDLPPAHEAQVRAFAALVSSEGAGDPT